MKQRCSWINIHNPLSIHYHDNEWGKSLFDDQKLFEILSLEGAQAGLSWDLILKKRENYKQYFCNFDIKKVANLDEEYFETLCQNPQIIRNKAKIFSIPNNAKIIIKIQKEYGSFSDYMWKFVNFSTIHNQVVNYKTIPSYTLLSKKISKDLKNRGMKFVGPTIIYSFMQAIGMVNDHENTCFCKNS